MLMKDGEKSDNKSSVKFDESQNVVKEFHKSQKIMNFNPPKKEESLKRKKPESEQKPAKIVDKIVEQKKEKDQVEVSFKPEEKKTHA